jgi:ADP-heptose:LPS heptosyltransferase
VFYLNHNPQLHSVKIYYKKSGKQGFFTSEGTCVFPPNQCHYHILGFGFHHHDEYRKMDKAFIKKILAKKIGIIYVCTKLPENPIIDKRLIYVETGFRWFTHFLFRNPTGFKAAFSSNNVPSAISKCKLFATHFGQSMPIIKSEKDLPELNKIKDIITTSKECLIETHDGLGDILMSLPTAKTLHDQGWKVNYLVEKGKKDIFKNLDYINEIYTQATDIPLVKTSRYIKLTNRLSNYSLDFNKQNRIYSTAYLAGLKKEELTTEKPILKLSKEEKKWAKKELKDYNKTVAICWHAVGSNRSYFKGLTQKLCDQLTEKGYTPIILSQEKAPFQNCRDYAGHTNLRELFALINEVDHVVSVDTGTLHIAGAFNKSTIGIFGPMKAGWRCSTYPNCYPLEPDKREIKCYPCADKQARLPEERMCNHLESLCLKTITPRKILYKLDEITGNVDYSINITGKEINKYKRKVKKRLKVKSILINRTSGLGDILMTTSAINAFKKQDPDIFITYRTNQPEVLYNNNKIHSIITTEMEHQPDLSPYQEEYDKIIDLNYMFESEGVSGKLGRISEEEYMNSPRLDILYKACGLSTKKIYPMIYKATKEEIRYAKKVLKGLKKKKTILYVLNSTSPYRTYPIDQGIKTIKRLLKNYNVVVVGTIDRMWKNSEHHFNKYYYKHIQRLPKSSFLDLSDQTSIRDVAALVKQCDLVITPDTGVMHLAEALKIKCLALFGNVDPRLRCSHYKYVKTVFKNLPCLCGDRHAYKKNGYCPDFEAVESSFTRRIGASCMRAIQPDEIIQKAGGIIK